MTLQSRQAGGHGHAGHGHATTPFRPFNPPNGDPLEKAFRCNGNAQCLSYAASVPMCPSFKATGDVRHSPKGRADALRAWHEDRRTAEATIDEADLLGTLDTCLGCKACSTTCPAQVDIPAMRAAFYADVYTRKARPLADRAMLLAERLSPLMLRASPVIRPFWPLARRAAEAVKGVTDLPADLAQPLPRSARVSLSDLKQRALPERAVLVWRDWFSALYDGATQRDVYQGLTALGYVPLFVEMLPAGKVAGDLGDRAGFAKMAGRMVAALSDGAASGAPMIGLDPAFVMALRQDYRKAGLDVPEVLLPHEFLAAEVRGGATGCPACLPGTHAAAEDQIQGHQMPRRKRWFDARTVSQMPCTLFGQGVSTEAY